MDNDLKFIKREEILKAIESHLQQVEQWGAGIIINYRIAWENYLKAEVLIEILEVHDCGSVGGFDVGQRKEGYDIHLTLPERYKWLKKKC